MRTIRLLTILSCSLFLIGCIGTIDNTIDTNIIEDSTHDCDKQNVLNFNSDTILFFGNTLTIDDSAHVMQQIKEIAAKDTMLSVDGRVLTVGEVGFGINVHGNGVTLISSVQIDAPKITPIVLYLTNLYGNPTETDSEEGYYWLDEGIRLRRLHSEEGGTVITFQSSGNHPY